MASSSASTAVDEGHECVVADAAAAVAVSSSCSSLSTYFSSSLSSFEDNDEDDDDEDDDRWNGGGGGDDDNNKAIRGNEKAIEDCWEPIPLAQARKQRRRRSSADAWVSVMKRRRQSSLKLQLSLQSEQQSEQQLHRPSLVVQGLDLAGLLDDECVELLWNAIADEEPPQEPTQEIQESNSASVRYSWYGNVPWDDWSLDTVNDDLDDRNDEEENNNDPTNNGNKRAKRRTSIVSLDGGEHALKDFASVLAVLVSEDDEENNEEHLLQQLLISIDTSADHNDNGRNDTDRNRDPMDAANADDNDDDDTHMWDPLDVNDMGTTAANTNTATTSSLGAIHKLLTNDEDARALILRSILD